MKRFLLFLPILMISLSSLAQPEIGIATLNFGDAIHIDDVSVEFVELISDSRCPEGVNCIRAGEAIVLVAIYRNGKFSHNKELIFHASGAVNQSAMQLFNSDYLNIHGLALYPYPKGLTKIVDQEYQLELQVN
ncbi:MAG: hypothetical protein HKO72_07235 [Flavobacteriaceae bacterium]|nr:hypothetical protein [Bacteroidia bacterium]NNK27045.1 hypothetical protein [Flavobacteriaceae bacterium]NNL61112.1 hypothetical protein [Flavobacteriaceae bacterium]